MRTWRRAFAGDRCGHCAKELGAGDPLLELRIGTMQRRLMRCPTCAGYPVPDDLPPPVERVPFPTTPLVLIPTGAGVLPLDFKARAIGERQPGEDD